MYLRYKLFLPLLVGILLLFTKIFLIVRLLFHKFQLFVANQNKPPEIISILTTNKKKLLRLLQDIKLDKGTLEALHVLFFGLITSQDVCFRYLWYINVYLYLFVFILNKTFNPNDSHLQDFFFL